MSILPKKLLLIPIFFISLISCSSKTSRFCPDGSIAEAHFEEGLFNIMRSEQRKIRDQQKIASDTLERAILELREHEQRDMNFFSSLVERLERDKADHENLVEEIRKNKEVD